MQTAAGLAFCLGPRNGDEVLTLNSIISRSLNSLFFQCLLITGLRDRLMVVLGLLDTLDVQNGGCFFFRERDRQFSERWAFLRPPSELNP